MRVSISGASLQMLTDGYAVFAPGSSFTENYVNSFSSFSFGIQQPSTPTQLTVTLQLYFGSPEQDYPVFTEQITVPA